MISVTAIGNLGRDGELKSAGSTEVVNFSIACRGRDKDSTTWVDCALFGKRAVSVAPYLKKGGRVGVMGTLSTREHNGKTYLKIDVQELELLGDKKDGAASSPKSEEPPQDEIPF